MKYNVEDAIIVATYEHDVKFPVETVPVELMGKERKRSLFSEFFDFLDIFDLFFEDEEEPVTPAEPEPEPAVITATYEQRIEEIHFAYFEFLD